MRLLAGDHTGAQHMPEGKEGRCEVVNASGGVGSGRHGLRVCMRDGQGIFHGFACVVAVLCACCVCASARNVSRSCLVDLCPRQSRR